jgi:four helix bundle protein
MAEGGTVPREDREVADIKSYRDLSVWQKAVDIVTEAYRLSETFPRSEDFGLRLQLRRAAISVPANIAEGHGRTGIGEYLHHLSIAHGSLAELETLLTVAGNLGYVKADTIESIGKQGEEVGRLLRALMRRLRDRAEADRGRRR